MQLRHLKGIIPASDQGIARVAAVCWSPNNKRLVIADSLKLLHFFDETGEKKDRFSTKPADVKGPKNYVIKGLAFSPDSTRLAVAQSDCIVYVYKLGVEWGDKKSICNKYQITSPVTCVVWPREHMNELVFGAQDGKVRVGSVRVNKASSLYSTDSPVVSLCCSPDGHGILSGHLDGSIYRFYFDDSMAQVPQGKIAQHSCVPYGLSWGESIVACGTDCRVAMFDVRDGTQQQVFDFASPPTYTGDDYEREFTAAACSPSGHSVIVGGFNKIRIFNYNVRRNVWEDAGAKPMPNLYTVTAICWKWDGSRLVLGGLCGSVDMFDACMRRYRYKGKFEFTYVSPSQVIVKRLSSGTRIVLKSHFGYEIVKVNVFRDQYLIAHTPTTLLMGDLGSCKLSEVPWSGSGNEKFFFDNPQVCMVFNAGELSLIEYGRNEILGSCRTEHMSPHLLSVRLIESKAAQAAAAAGIEPPEMPGDESKTIAYLIDRQTIRMTDLISGLAVATISHDAKVDWLELNERATKLLFRDKRRQLHLFDIASQQKTTLLNFCSYVQWVPGSDVVVAQNRGDLCVWYNIDSPDRVTIVAIKGDVEDIERGPGRTEVIVDEGINTVSYALDEALIEFGSAIEDRDFERAADLLEQLELTPETEAMWQNLSNLALQDRKLHIAERCYAAVGDISKARSIKKIINIADYVAEQMGGDGMDHFAVRAKLAVLSKDFKRAEQIYLEQGQVDEAMGMYEELHRYDESIAVATAKGHPEAAALRDKYYQWLIDTRQEEKAAELKEKEGKYTAAITLYLQGGMPARAAHVVNANGITQPSHLLEAIAAALFKAGMFDKAGEFFEKLDLNQRAVEAYRKGHAYRRAVELSRRAFPGDVVALEEEWGDWLVSQKQVDAAINHYIEAGQYIKAVEAAITSRQWTKAVQIVDSLDPSVAKQFHRRIARHYDESGNWSEAERLYIKAGLAKEAVEMHSRNGQWDAASRVASTYLSESDAAAMYITQAQRLESQGKLKDAEKMYVKVSEYDLAINMYKKNRQFDQMVRLVSTYRKELLQETHLHLGQQLESEGQLKTAEYHYVQAKDWKSAVNMYRANDMWDDAIRVAKLHGGVNASKHVAYAWAASLGGEAGAKLLTKFGLIEQAIDYAMESGAFEHAFELANASLKSKLPDLYLKHAMFLEDEGRFKEAEEEFVKAGKPKEAIDMYVHQHDWNNAMRVAEAYDPPSVSDVLLAQARLAFERKDFERAEAYFLRAKKPELLIKMYKDARMWTEAQRVAREYNPQKLREVTSEYAKFMTNQSPAERDMGSAGGSGPSSGGDSPIATAKMWEESGEYSRAIDAYLSVRADPRADPDFLEEAWESAVKLAMSHVQGRISEVVVTVAKRLVEIGRHLQAAELYQGIDMHKEAIEIYMSQAQWDRARDLAEHCAPHLSQYVQSAYTSHLVKGQKADELASSGNVNAALDMYVQKGDWDKCLEMSQKQGPPVLLKYLSIVARQLTSEGQFARAVELLSKYMTASSVPYSSMNPSDVSVYTALARALLNAHPPVPDKTVTQLRQLLFNMVPGLKAINVSGSKDAERFLQIAHLCALKQNVKGAGLPEVYSRLCMSLVRYCADIPADRAFLEAGQACKESGVLNSAFVFLNRYLDLSELMDDPESTSVSLENADFEGTDIPYDFPIPEKHSLDEDDREEIRQWVLTNSLERNIDPSLTTKPCEKCGEAMYEGSLVCPRCNHDYPPCIVTGFPIRKSTKVNCKSCTMPANKEDWTKYVSKFKACPWCNSPQSGL